MVELSSPEMERVARLYAKAKKIIIECEEFGELQKSNIAVLIELRAAFDHFMRCISNNFSEDAKDDEYQKKQIEDTTMHIVRAACSSLIGLSISVLMQISKNMDSINADAIATVFPEYYSKYINKIKIAKEEIYKYTNKKKDVFFTEDIDKLIEKINELRQINQEIEAHLPDMVRIQKGIKKPFTRQAALISSIIGLILLGVGVLIGRII